MTDSPRRLARELVLKGLYAAATGVTDRENILSEIVSGADIGSRSLAFARALFTRVSELESWADQQITTLADNWHIDRIARIDREILRMAMVELREFPDVPVKVVLNEAIELAKKYSTAESSRFVNGVLDRFVKVTPSLQSGNSGKGN